MPEISREELKKHDGTGENGAFVAVNNVVYDVSASPMWEKGVHMGAHHAGADLTDALTRAPHGIEMLDRYPQAGELEPDAEPEETAPVAVSSARKIPGWASFLIALHSHPVSVHFPQAIFLLAPVFLTLFCLIGFKDFERTAFFLMVTGLLTSIPATLTGFLHWWFKYGGSSKSVFKLKIILSPLLVILAAVTSGIHFGVGTLQEGDPRYWEIVILYWIPVPIITVLGKLGGTIIFGKNQPTT